MSDTRLLPLRLIASPGAWRLYSARKSDPKFASYQEKIWQRDKYVCQFCGFQAKSFQDVVNVDNDYTHNSPSNMATACCFCAQCFFIESVGVGGFGGGSLIYLPEMSQTEVNSLCHVMFCAITNDTGFKSSAQDIYRSLKIRTQSIEEKYGEGTSDPAAFGQMLIDTGTTSQDKQLQIFQDIRLLPARAKFRRQIETWAAQALMTNVG